VKGGPITPPPGAPPEAAGLTRPCAEPEAALTLRLNRPPTRPGPSAGPSAHPRRPSVDRRRGAQRPERPLSASEALLESGGPAIGCPKPASAACSGPGLHGHTTKRRAAATERRQRPPALRPGARGRLSLDHRAQPATSNPFPTGALSTASVTSGGVRRPLPVQLSTQSQAQVRLARQGGPPEHFDDTTPLHLPVQADTGAGVSRPAGAASASWPQRSRLNPPSSEDLAAICEPNFNPWIAKLSRAGPAGEWRFDTDHAGRAGMDQSDRPTVPRH